MNSEIFKCIHIGYQMLLWKICFSKHRDLSDEIFHAVYYYCFEFVRFFSEVIFEKSANTISKGNGLFDRTFCLKIIRQKKIAKISFPNTEHLRGKKSHFLS
jgi:hypothetical protein